MAAGARVEGGILENDSGDDLNRPLGMATLTRRDLFQCAGLAMSAATVPFTRTRAAPAQSGGGPTPSVSPVMEKLSTYMSEAALRPLPGDVV
jgi:hypothetical protein